MKRKDKRVIAKYDLRSGMFLINVSTAKVLKVHIAVSTWGTFIAYDRNGLSFLISNFQLKNYRALKGSLAIYYERMFLDIGKCNVVYNGQYLYPESKAIIN